MPPTSALVAIMFGTRWLTMLLGIAFFSHQVGGFLGVWLGGLLFERTGSYDVIWWGTILFGVLRRSSTCRLSRSQWCGQRCNRPRSTRHPRPCAGQPRLYNLPVE